MAELRIDPFRLMHWMNARKLTPAMVAARSGIAHETLVGLRKDEGGNLNEEAAASLAAALNVPVGHLVGRSDGAIAAIYMSRAEIEATKRPIERDGIHFYNYYSLPAPKGEVGPVILDILCPNGRLPKLNNGHLEPAITINLGPGHIHGRWGEEIGPDTWQVLGANQTGEEPWIIGDSYVEPAYCPHTYALAGNKQARILSYTVKSNLDALFDRTHGWSDDAFERFSREHRASSPEAAALKAHMERRGWEAETLAKTTGVDAAALDRFLGGNGTALGEAELGRLAEALGVDRRQFVAPKHLNDPLGKTHCTVVDAIRSVRPYKSYRVASMASSTRFPDLTGMFMQVAKAAHEKPEARALDLCDFSNTLYIVTSGDMQVHWVDADGSLSGRALREGDALWLGPYVAHGFFGTGSLIKMGNGEGVSYLDQIELANTFDRSGTIARARRDSEGWGYVDRPAS